jgi:replicative DNA helicase
VDHRSDELLEEGARFVHRHGLALSWTDGLVGSDAKRCRRNGWKNAARLNRNEVAAVGYFVARARKANPAIPAVANGLVLVEVDLDVPEDAYPPLDEVIERVAALMRRLGLRFPETTIVHSRRGVHFYLRPPEECLPAKVQLAEEGDLVTWSTDGYVIPVPGLHKLPRVVYEFVRNGAIATLPADMYERLQVLADESRRKARRAYEAGAQIPTGSRRETIFSLTLDRVRDGADRDAVMAELLDLNTARCRPPLTAVQVVEQIDGAIRWADKNPTESERARAEARRVLNDPRSKSAPAAGLIWEEPVPLGMREAVPEFDVSLLSSWMGDFASAITAEKGAALDLGAILVLDVVAGGLARHVQVSPRPGWFEPVNLYTVVALAPGQRKSPVFKAALRPVRTLEQQLIRAWEEQETLTAMAGAIFDKRRKALIDQAAADQELDPEQLRGRMDELLDGLGDIEPPPRPRLLAEDVTPEALAGLLADHGRIIVASDEGGALFENLAGRYAHGSTAWDTFNKAHSGVDLVVDRKSSGTVIVFDPAITLGIVSQPELLRSLVGKPGADGRGVLARPLYAVPTPAYAEGATPAADTAVIEEYARRIRNLYNDTPQLEHDDDLHPRPAMLTFRHEARESFERFETELNRERRELGGNDLDGDSVYLGWLSKLAGQTARLAAVLHAADHWSDGTGTAASLIDEPTVRRAIQLARYFRAHALAAFGLMGELPDQRRARDILRWLQARTPSELDALTVRAVHRSRGKGTTAEHVRNALRILEEHGFVRLDRAPRAGSAGRASERVHVHPAASQTANTPDRPDRGSPMSGLSGNSPEPSPCADHPEAGAWLSRDGIWRCRECEPPAFPGEIVKEREW